MAQVTISVSFTSLLEKIVQSVYSASPIYSYSSSKKNMAYVIVPTNTGASSYVFNGVCAQTMAESCEFAAWKAVMFLVRNKNIYVHDVNSERKERLTQCCNLYMFKRHELECAEKGVERLDAEAFLGDTCGGSSRYDIYLDFVEVLREVVKKVGVRVTNMECISYRNGDFLAWFAVSLSGNKGVLDYISGDREASMAQAKQSLAKKALLFLMPSYGFSVEDVSFHLMNKEELGVKIARENYLAVKDRVYGLREDVEPKSVLIEQDQLTPRSERFTLSVPDAPPLPPKKRKLVQKKVLEPTMPHSVVEEELNNLFKEYAKD